MATMYTRQVRDFGFEGTGLFDDSAYHSAYKRVFPKARVVLAILNAPQRGVIRYDLTASQMRRYARGGLSLIPPGCCAPCTPENQQLHDFRWVYEGEIRDKRHLRAILRLTGLPFPD